MGGGWGAALGRTRLAHHRHTLLHGLRRAAWSHVGLESGFGGSLSVERDLLVREGPGPKQRAVTDILGSEVYIPLS